MNTRLPWHALASCEGGFVHLGKLRYGPEWDSLREDARFQKLVADAEAALNAQSK